MSDETAGARVQSTIRPPTEISPDGRELWDWAARLSDRVQALDELKKLRAQVHNARSTCGSCTAWMTDDCPREVHNNLTGRKQGPSSMAIKCDRFSMSSVTANSVAKAEEKMAALDLRLHPPR